MRILYPVFKYPIHRCLCLVIPYKEQRPRKKQVSCDLCFNNSHIEEEQSSIKSSEAYKVLAYHSLVYFWSNATIIQLN